MTKVFYLKCDELIEADFFNALIKLLPGTMQSKIEQLHNPYIKQDYALGKVMLLNILYSYHSNLHLDQLKYNAHGRPYFSGSIDFNLSHSHGHIICILSDECSVGIDIEVVLPIEIASFEAQFNINEWRKIKEAHSKNNHAAFYCYWTQKEAAVKADGRGLAIPLRQVQIRNSRAIIENKCWFIRRVNVCNDVMVHVASSKSIELVLKTFRLKDIEQFYTRLH